MRLRLLGLSALAVVCGVVAAPSERAKALTSCQPQLVLNHRAVANCRSPTDAVDGVLLWASIVHGSGYNVGCRTSHHSNASECLAAEVRLSHMIGVGSRLAVESAERGQIFNTMGDLPQTFATIADAIKQGLNAASFHRRRADAKRMAGDHEGAIAAYSEAIRLDPKSAETFYLRGFTRRDKGDWQGAIIDYDEAIRLNPRYANAYAVRANARRELGDLAGAKADADKAIRLDPKNLLAFNNRGVIRYQEGNFAGAAADHSEAISIAPNFVLAWHGRGNARSYLGDKEGAIADYSEALRLHRDDSASRVARAFERRTIGDFNGALEDYLVAQQLLDAEGVLSDLCITRFHLGQREEAMLTCKMAQQKAAPTDGWPFSVEAGLLLLANDLAGAETALKVALSREPRSAHALRLRSVLHSKRGNLSEADRDRALAWKGEPWIEQALREVYGHALFR